MVDKIASVLLFIVGIVNILPIAVFFVPSQSVKLYGVSLEGESLTILMRHRGVLLAIVGLTLIFAAFKAEFRVFAVAVALLSKFAFIFLTYTAPGYSAEVGRVALIDVGAIVVLLAILAVHFYSK